MKFYPIFLILLLSSLFDVCAVESPIKKIRAKEKYSAVTTSAPSLDLASWFIPNEAGTFDAGCSNAVEVLAHYRTKPVQFIKDGIFVVSYTHSIPLTDKEKKKMSPHLLMLVQHKPWRDAENKLVDELVTAANKEGIPVWINVTMDMAGLYPNKLLTDPKLTLKK